MLLLHNPSASKTITKAVLASAAMGWDTPVRLLFLAHPPRSHLYARVLYIVHRTTFHATPSSVVLSFSSPFPIRCCIYTPTVHARTRSDTSPPPPPKQVGLVWRRTRSPRTWVVGAIVVISSTAVTRSIPRYSVIYASSAEDGMPMTPGVFDWNSQPDKRWFKRYYCTRDFATCVCITAGGPGRRKWVMDKVVLYASNR